MNLQTLQDQIDISDISSLVLSHQITFSGTTIYGQVESPRQGEIIRGLAILPIAELTDVSKLAKALVREMRESEHTNYPVKNEVA